MVNALQVNDDNERKTVAGRDACRWFAGIVFFPAVFVGFFCWFGHSVVTTTTKDSEFPNVLLCARHLDDVDDQFSCAFVNADGTPVESYSCPEKRTPDFDSMTQTNSDEILCYIWDFSTVTLPIETLFLAFERPNHYLSETYVSLIFDKPASNVIPTHTVVEAPSNPYRSLSTYIYFVTNKVVDINHAVERWVDTYWGGTVEVDKSGINTGIYISASDVPSEVSEQKDDYGWIPIMILGVWMIEWLLYKSCRLTVRIFESLRKCKFSCCCNVEKKGTNEKSYVALKEANEHHNNMEAKFNCCTWIKRDCVNVATILVICVGVVVCCIAVFVWLPQNPPTKLKLTNNENSVPIPTVTVCPGKINPATNMTCSMMSPNGVVDASFECPVPISPPPFKTGLEMYDVKCYSFVFSNGVSNNTATKNPYKDYMKTDGHYLTFSYDDVSLSPPYLFFFFSFDAYLNPTFAVFDLSRGMDIYNMRYTVYDFTDIDDRVRSWVDGSFGGYELVRTSSNIPPAALHLRPDDKQMHHITEYTDVTSLIYAISTIVGIIIISMTFCQMFKGCKRISECACISLNESPDWLRKFIVGYMLSILITFGATWWFVDSVNKDHILQQPFSTASEISIPTFVVCTDTPYVDLDSWECEKLIAEDGGNPSTSFSCPEPRQTITNWSLPGFKEFSQCITYEFGMQESCGEDSCMIAGNGDGIQIRFTSLNTAVALLTDDPASTLSQPKFLPARRNTNTVYSFYRTEKCEDKAWFPYWLVPDVNDLFSSGCNEHKSFLFFESEAESHSSVSQMQIILQDNVRRRNVLVTKFPVVSAIVCGLFLLSCFILALNTMMTHQVDPNVTVSDQA